MLCANCPIPRKFSPRCDELVAVGWRTFAAKREVGEPLRAAGIRRRRVVQSMRRVVQFQPVRNDLTASNVKLDQMKPEKLPQRGQRNVECGPIWGAFPFRGFLKGNLRASSGIVVGIAPFLSPPRNKVRGRGEVTRMNRLTLGFAMAAFALLSGCTTPVRIKLTGANGEVRELDVKDSTGKIVEVSNSSREKIDKLVPAIEKEIVSVLNAKVAQKDFKGKYEINCDKSIGSVAVEPLTDEEKVVVRNVIACLLSKHTEEIVYRAWASELAFPVLAEAKKKLASDDYAGAREVIWGVSSCGEAAVDSQVQNQLVEFLNKKVNPAQWAVVEKDLSEKFLELMREKKYNEAVKFAKAYPEIRTFSSKLSEPPAYTGADKVDSDTELGTVAFNGRLAALKEKLQGELASAKQAELDAKMQAKADDLIARIVAAVRAEKFAEARDMIRDFELVNDSQWNAKLYVVRIGLLNTVVNPHQLEFEKAAILAKVKELVTNGDKAGAIKYLESYSYVHDTFAQIMSAVSDIKVAMKGLEIEEAVSAEYEAGLRQRLQQIIEQRLGDKVGDGPKATEDLEKALSELEKGYVAQHFDEALAGQLRDAVRKEVLALADFRRNPMTTWELNEALKAYIAELLASLLSESGEKPAAQVSESAVNAVPVMDYDVQIAMAEAAIQSPAPLYGFEAVLGDYARIMRRMKKGGSVSKEEATSLLVGSVFLNQPKVFKQATQLGADVNAAPRRDGLMRPAILVAVVCGRYEFVDEIVTLKGDMKVVDGNGDTVLHYAVERGNLPLVNKVASAVDPKSVNKAGETALFTAVKRNQLQVAKFLLAMFGDEKARKEYVETKNAAGMTAFAYACTVNAHMLLDTLAEAGAEFNEEDLAKAAANNCVGAAQWLVEQGLDVNDPKVLEAIKNMKKGGAKDAVNYLKGEGLKATGGAENAKSVQDPKTEAK